MKKKMLTATVCVLAFGMVANAATINYMVKLNGTEYTEVTPAQITPGVEFTLEIWANCPDIDFGSGLWGGVLQYAVNVVDSAGHLTPTEGVGGPPLFLPNGMWASSSVAPMTNFAGELDKDGKDVLAQAGQIAPTAFDANYGTFGAGPGVWSKVGEGPMTWDGGITTLTVEPWGLDGMLVYGMAGAEEPTASSGDSVDFVPEPATMSLLALGGLALLRRRR